MSRLTPRNFALHVVLAPDEHEQVLALLQEKNIKKRSVIRVTPTYHFNFYLKGLVGIAPVLLSYVA